MSAASAAPGITGHDRQRRPGWMALSLTTLPVTASFWAAVVAFVAADAGDDRTAAGAAALAVAIAPLGLVVAALTSRHPHPLWAATAGAVAGPTLGVVVLALSQDAVTGLVAGFGTAVAAALRRPPWAEGFELYGRRLAAVGIAAVLAFVLVHTVTFLALASGPALAIVAVGLADDTAARRRD
ncbi:MAG: hypothetical protein R2761_26305 [Acidimicrobiales bacterium]